MIKAILAAIVIAAVPVTVSAQEGDAELLARLIYTEARGECRGGQLMVAQTVLDRLEDGRWGDSVYDVIRSPGQFAGPGRLTPELLEVAQSALDGERYSRSRRILFFRVSRCSGDWYAPFVGRIGGHAYYGHRRRNLWIIIVASASDPNLNSFP